MYENIKLTKDLMHEVIERSIKRKNYGIEFDLSGISPFLNNLTYGLQRGKLTVIGGRPSNGKTALMGDIAYNLIEQGKRVAFISLEMEGIDIAERLMSRIFLINNRYFFTGKAVDEITNKQAGLVNKVYERYKNLAITQNIGFTFKELSEVIKKYLESFDVIILDYLQMVKGSATAKEVMDEYIKHLRQLAVETNKVIVLGSQINRAGAGKDKEEKLPTMSDLKGTGCIEEVADVCILCHWQYFYSKDENDKNKYQLIVAKNRATGLTGIVHLNYEPEFYRFTAKGDYD